MILGFDPAGQSYYTFEHLTWTEDQPIELIEGIPNEIDVRRELI